MTIRNGPLAPPPTIEASESTAPTGLVGFDVDSTGGVVIARTAGGGTINTYSGFTLSPIANLASNCTKINGVMAIRTHVAYLDCDSGGPEVFKRFNIKSLDLGAPQFPTGCGDACITGFALSDFTPESDQFDEIQDLIVFPISREFFIQSGSFSFLGFEPSAKKFSVAGWSFTTNLTIGAALHNAIDDASDKQEASKKTFGVPGTEKQICTARKPASTNAEGVYIAAIQTGSTTQSFDVTFTAKSEAGPTGLVAWVDVDVQNPITYSGTFTNAHSIACAGNTIIITTDRASGDEIIAFNKQTGGILWRSSQQGVTTSNPPSRSVAVSGNGLFAAFLVSPTEALLANATSGEVLARMDVPSGTFRGIQMDETASGVWIATSTNISRFDVSGFTASQGIGEEPAPAPPPVGNQVIQDKLDNIQPGTFGGDLFMAAVTLLFGTVVGAGAMGGVAKGSAHVAILGGMMGAVAAFLIAWGFGFLTDSAVYVVGVIVTLLLILLILAGRRG